METRIKEGVKLRHFRKEDVNEYFDCFQSDLGKDSFLRYFTKPEQLQKEIESIVKQYTLKKPSEETFVIEVDNEFAGFIDIEGLNSTSSPHKINLGYGLRKKFRGLGLCTEAVKVVCDYAFDKYTLKKIEVSSRSDNIASIKVLEKTGFQLERVLKNNVYKNGKIYDEMIFSRIK